MLHKDFSLELFAELNLRTQDEPHSLERVNSHNRGSKRAHLLSHSKGQGCWSYVSDTGTRFVELEVCPLQPGSVRDSRWSWLQQTLGHSSVHISYSWGRVRRAERGGCWLCEISISSTKACICCDVQPILTGYRCDL